MTGAPLAPTPTPAPPLARAVPPHTPSPVRPAAAHRARPVGGTSPPDRGSPSSRCKSCVMAGVPLGPGHTPRLAHARVVPLHTPSPVCLVAAHCARPVGSTRPADWGVTPTKWKSCVMTGVPLGPTPTLARALSRVVTPHMSSPVRPVATHRAQPVGGGSPPNWGSPPT